MAVRSPGTGENPHADLDFLLSLQKQASRSTTLNSTRRAGGGEIVCGPDRGKNTLSLTRSLSRFLMPHWDLASESSHAVTLEYPRSGRFWLHSAFVFAVSEGLHVLLPGSATADAKPRSV